MTRLWSVLPSDLEGDARRGALIAALLVVCLSAALLASAASALAVAPTISDEQPIWVDKDKATLRAQVNPNSLATNYYFEWGTSTAYGKRIPVDFDPSIGSGASPSPVVANLTGLELGTTYHYRVVATNASGTTTGPDRQFETLNHCGLMNNRCFELVSPADKGPDGIAGMGGGNQFEFHSQISTTGEKIVYSMGYTIPGATTGGELVYQSERSPFEWTPHQITPGLLVPSEISGGTNTAGRTLALSKDLSCAIQASPEPLTPDTPTRTTELGLSNLFRRDANGNYTVITHLPPTNSGVQVGNEYVIVGMTDDCNRVVFFTGFEYPGVPGAGSPRLYEWDHGTLRNVGVVPSPSGDVDVPANPNTSAGLSATTSLWRAVSEDGSRIFFSASRLTSPLAGEIGKDAIFVRVNGSQTLDVSRSETAVANLGTRYQTASRDGRFVFFTANYGLTSNSSTGAATCNVTTGVGCDLYRYDLQAGDLVNLSADTNPADTTGASVPGVLDASDDGSLVYFAARGQLEIGKGSTLAQNTTNGTYNIYLSRNAGAPEYAGLLRTADLRGSGFGVGALIDISTMSNSRWTARATPNGSHLLFASTANVTSYVSGNRPQEYLFISGSTAGSGKTICVSCPPDGQPSLTTGYRTLTGGGETQTKIYRPEPMTADGKHVFFKSSDVLAPGGVAGQQNIYEWEQGQVALLATEMPGVFGGLRYSGVSPDGENVVFVTPRPLTAHDPDERFDVYTARVGGGFADPPLPPVSCDPSVEGSCQGGGASEMSSGSATAGPGSSNAPSSLRASFSVQRLAGSQLASLIAGRSTKLSVKVNQAGKVTVTGTARVGGFSRRVVSASSQAAGAGQVSVAIRLSPAARKALSSGRRVKVALSVGFSKARSPVGYRLNLKAAKSKKRVRSVRGGAR